MNTPQQPNHLDLLGLPGSLPRTKEFRLPEEPAGDPGDRVIHLHGSIAPEMSLAVVNQLLKFNAADEDLPVHMQVFSPGGCVISGLAIVDAMHHIAAPVYTYGIGCAASMAAIILACGERGHRYILPHSVVMIHQPSGSVGGTLDNVRATMGFHDQLEEHTTRLLSAATGRTPKAIRKATRIDNWFSAGKAVSFGLVDHILCETSPTEHRPS